MFTIVFVATAFLRGAAIPERAAAALPRTPLRLQLSPEGAADRLVTQLVRSPGEALLSLLGKSIDTVLSMDFMDSLDERIARAAGDERQELKQLRASVIDFAEEVAAGVQRLEPDFNRWAEDEAVACRGVVAAADPSQPPRRRAGSDVAAVFSPQLPPVEGDGAEQIERARGRFRLQQLLSAAKASA